MHELDKNKRKIIVFQEEGLIPDNIQPFFDSRINETFLIDLYSHIVLEWMPISLQFNVGVNQGYQNDWVQSQNAKVLW